MKKKHTHRMVVRSWSGLGVIFRCSVKDCTYSVPRPLTREEKTAYRQWIKDDDRRSKEMFGTWWDFCKRFMLSQGGEEETKWKFVGWELMQKVRKWASKHPEVIITSCDDSYAANSILVFIPTFTEDTYHNTSVVFIPQFGGQPAEIGLYPHSHKSAMNALAACKKRFRPDSYAHCFSKVLQKTGIRAVDKKSARK